MSGLKDEKIVVLLYPCNQFLGQEPGVPNKKTIRSMSTQKLDIEDSQVILMSKVDVNGDKADPVWQFLRYNSSLYNEKNGKISPIPWNFSKFLVDSSGGVTNFFSPKTGFKDIVPSIRTLLSMEAAVCPTPSRPKTIWGDGIGISSETTACASSRSTAAGVSSEEMGH